VSVVVLGAGRADVRGGLPGGEARLGPVVRFGVLSRVDELTMLGAALVLHECEVQVTAHHTDEMGEQSADHGSR
jgi:hypothetical protein